jgi:hypothetical protein
MASLGTWPSTRGVMSCRMELRANQRVNAAPGGGSEQVVDLLNDRWVMYLTLPAETNDNAHALEAFLHSFRGQTNTVLAWHFKREAPRGTMRGTPTIKTTVAAGASQIVIATGVPGCTLEPGDMVGSMGLLLMGSAAGTADGAGDLTLNLVNRLRTGLTAGDAVTWDKPTATFRKLSDSGVNYFRGTSEEVSLVLGEVIA